MACDPKVLCPKPTDVDRGRARLSMKRNVLMEFTAIGQQFNSATLPFPLVS
ncbi:unnamed protein product [Dovyalis caffra]|uniref:Uncharacterized protein n=1 Tax=Dovyalis caffra TaxID=77055 RepID=A0AAV1S3D9_9ROSI|nr:unnamed protein product [Dovyalis caffra]